MGSDVMEGGILFFLIKLLSRFYWNITIVKSEELAYRVGKSFTRTIPNGVNLSVFKPLMKKSALIQSRVGFGKGIYIVPLRPDPARKKFHVS